MPSLDDLKKRITSVKSTQKITKAMKMVAAAKLKRAQENAEKGRPFSEKMNNIILNLSSSISDKDMLQNFWLGQERTIFIYVWLSRPTEDFVVDLIPTYVEKPKTILKKF